MENKQISVVIPTFQRTPLLRKCLLALTRQSMAPEAYEILVVGDGYEAQTETLVDDFQRLFPHEIRYLHTDGKKGPAAARNLGWLDARGYLIAFTDDDCLPQPTWLEEILKAYSGDECIAYSGRVIVPVGKRPTDFEKNLSHLEEAEFVTANCACTKKALYRVGGFDEQFRIAWREDSDLHFKFIEHQIPLIKLPEAVVLHPARKVKWGNSIREQRKGVYNVLLFKKFPEIYRSRISHPMLPLYYALCVLLMLGCWAYLEGKLRLFALCVTCWAILTVYFTAHRLKGTAPTLSHLTEMMLTSLVIPYVSIYWRLYGWIKYRVIML